MPSVWVTRRLAVAAGAALLVGASVMTFALVATPRRWTSGYVSEVGAAGMPYAGAYRIGVFVLAVGVALLGAGLASIARRAALLLGAGAALATASGAVACSTGCPLPPYEASTAADLLHAAVSILGVAAVSFAMVALARCGTAPAVLRRLAGGFAVAAFPLAAVQGLGILIAGRGSWTAGTERLLLAVSASWLLVTAALLATTALATDAGQQADAAPQDSSQRSETVR